MAHSNPRVSVILPVYNGEKYLRESIDSVLAQSFEEFELIIVNDGSRDSSGEIAQQYQDSRVIYREQKNQGLAATLNNGAKLAKGEYLARQDQDDLSLPERLTRQVAFMDAHPDCAVLGTWSQVWVEDRSTDRTLRHATDNDTLQCDVLFDSPFVHSSVLMRRSSFETVGGYTTDRDRQPPEDFELWSRMARKYELANLSEVLHVYREVAGSMSRIEVNPFLDKVVMISGENIAACLGVDVSDPTVAVLAELVHHRPDALKYNISLEELRVQMLAIVDKLETLPQADRSRLIDAMTRYWQRVVHNYPRHTVRRTSDQIRRRALRLMQGDRKDLI